MARATLHDFVFTKKDQRHCLRIGSAEHVLIVVFSGAILTLSGTPIGYNTSTSLENDNRSAHELGLINVRDLKSDSGQESVDCSDCHGFGRRERSLSSGRTAFGSSFHTDT